ncbi:MAG: ABC transporter ATP-binding protein [Thermoprotei archaeon]
MVELLRVSGLSVGYTSYEGYTRVLRNVSFSLGGGEVLGVVGESGSGKTTLALAIARLLPPYARVEAGSIVFNGVDLLSLDERGVDGLRGTGVFMVFQDPFMSLNPLMRVGDQLVEAIRVRCRRQGSPFREEDAVREAVEHLRRVRITDPEDVARRYPHQLSGGQNQRVMLAMALAERPRLIIADEPTTALDVTTQAQVLSLFREIVDEEEMAMMFITHDLAVASSISDRIAVLYAGYIQEIGSAKGVLQDPKHPYTVALINSVPTKTKYDGKLEVYSQRNPTDKWSGEFCVYAPRCAYVHEACVKGVPALIQLEDRLVRCVNYGEKYE